MDQKQRIGTSDKLTLVPGVISDPLDLAKSMISFLILPIPTVEYGSIFLNSQSYENLIWYVLYILFCFWVVGYRTEKSIHNLIKSSLILFSVTFVLISGLTEVNLGTAIRHRSVLLIIILLSLTQMGQSRRFYLKR